MQNQQIDFEDIRLVEIRLIRVLLFFTEDSVSKSNLYNIVKFYYI